MNPNLVSFVDILPTCLAWADASSSNKKGSSAMCNYSHLPILEADRTLPIETSMAAARVWISHIP